MKNYPNTIQIGNVQDVNGHEYTDIDLLIGGSPCQDLSISKQNRTGLSGSRSSLFYEYLRILHEVHPRYFILENVASMVSTDRDIITKEMGVDPIMIDAAMFSAQQRKRYFWTNIPSVTVPSNMSPLMIRDILDIDAPRKFIHPVNIVKTARGIRWDVSGKGYSSQQDRAYSIHSKAPTISATRTVTKSNILFDDGRVGVPNWNEFERLQSMPDGYSDLGIKNRVEKRGGVLGNSFNVDVVAHILKHIK